MRYDEQAILEAGQAALAACEINGDTILSKVVMLCEIMSEGQIRLVSLSSRMTPWQTLGLLAAETIKQQGALIGSITDGRGFDDDNAT